MAGICFGGGRVGLRRICFDMEYVRERVKIRGWGGAKRELSISICPGPGPDTKIECGETNIDK